MTQDRRPPPAPKPATGEAGGEGRKPPVGGPRSQPPGEIGGPKGPEPTRYGDWEKGGRCIDF